MQRASLYKRESRSLAVDRELRGDSTRAGQDCREKDCPVDQCGVRLDATEVAIGCSCKYTS